MGNLFKFWWRVTVRGWKMTKQKIGEGFAALLYLIFGYLVVPSGIAFIAWLGLGKFNILVPSQESIIDEIALVMLIILMIVVIFGILNFVKIPPILYEEHGGFVENPIILSPEKHPDPMNGDVDYTRGIRVKNITHFDVTDCMLRLMSITDMETNLPIERREEDLLWSAREGAHNKRLEPKTINGNDYIQCDVAYYQSKGYSAQFTLCHARQGIPIGKYKLEIKIKGKWKDHNLVENTQNMILEFDGTQILLDSEIENNRPKR